MSQGPNCTVQRIYEFLAADQKWIDDSISIFNFDSKFNNKRIAEGFLKHKIFSDSARQAETGTND